MDMDTTYRVAQKNKLFVFYIFLRVSTNLMCGLIKLAQGRFIKAKWMIKLI